MNKFNYKLLLIILVIVGISSCSSERKDHVGKWKGVEDTGSPFIIELDDDGYAAITIGNQVLGGSHEAEGENSLKYEVNYEQTPYWLDLIRIDENGKEVGRIKSIFRLEGQNKLFWKGNMNDPGNRPFAFDPKDTLDTISLKREK